MSRAVLRVLLVPVLVACGSDATPVAPSVAATCDGVSVAVRTLEPLESVVVTGADVACVALGGADREFLVVPQLTGAALPYGGYGFRLGAPAAIAATTRTDAALPLFARVDTVGADASPLDAQARLDAHLRRLEATTPPPARVSGRAAITPRLAGATVDSLRRFSVLNTLAATAAYTGVDARLAFAGTRVLLYVDTLATSAFTPSELQGLGTLADQRLTPIVTEAFGGGSDLDGNGRVIFLLTPVVNGLAPAPQCATSGFVRGFFYSHDLASTASTSNRGEIFYGYVPDPAGRWGCAHSRADVLANLPPTFIHELQHMVSYGEHAVERGGEAEQPWLNEALSHVAEELGSLSYESRFPAPSGRTNPAQLFPDSAGPFITPNLLYSYRFLFSKRRPARAPPACWRASRSRPTSTACRGCRARGSRPSCASRAATCDGCTDRCSTSWVSPVACRGHSRSSRCRSSRRRASWGRCGRAPFSRIASVPPAP